MKVGIMTLPLRGNYGGVLQAYALQRFLKNNQVNAILIDRAWDRSESSGLLYQVQKFIFHHFIWRNVIQFSKKWIQPRTNKIASQIEMMKINEHGFDAIIVGSDQVWRVEFTGGVKNNYFLDFLKNDATKRIAYAPSFGTKDWKGTPEQTAKIKKLLKKFTAISVRERSGVTICKDFFGVNTENVLDPTFLLDKDEYLNILPKKFRKKNSVKLVTYILDKSEIKCELIKGIAKRKRLTVKSINVKKNPMDLRKKVALDIYNYAYPSVYSWIRGFRDADFIVTDSFHGTVFSIIFQKQFIVFGNNHRGMERFISILETLGLSDRLIYDLETADLNPIIDKIIDYDIVKSKLDVEIEKSKRFLMEALRSQS